jgi:hypothetical protein
MAADGWVKSSQSLITISAFLAGISAALLILILNQRLPGVNGDSLAVISTSLVLSIALFAIASEVFTDALEFSDASRSIQAVMAHDTAVALFLLALSEIVWTEGLIVAAIVAAGFSSYFTKDVIWLLWRSNRGNYGAWLVSGKLKHDPEKLDKVSIVASGLTSAVAASAAAAYLYNLSDPASSSFGFITAIAIGYVAFGIIYLTWAEFSLDAKITMTVGMFLLLVSLVGSRNIMILIGTISAILGLALLFCTKTRVSESANQSSSGSTFGKEQIWNPAASED